MLNYKLSKLDATNSYENPYHTEKGEGMVPLNMMEPGRTVRVCRITGRDDVRRHLSELGFTADADVTIISRVGGGMILQLRDGRIALDERMAGRILVR